jgi:hypothetical protein
VVASSYVILCVGPWLGYRGARVSLERHGVVAADRGRRRDLRADRACRAVARQYLVRWLLLPVERRDGASGAAYILRLRHNRDNEHVTFPPFPCDRYPSSGHPLRDLPSHRRVPPRQPQRGPDRALPPGPSRSARRGFPVAGHGDTHSPQLPSLRRKPSRPAIGSYRILRSRPPHHLRVHLWVHENQANAPFSCITYTTYNGLSPKPAYL